MNAGYSSDGNTGEPTRAAVRVDDGTPRVLQTLAGWSWRVLAVTAAVLTVAITLRFFSEITIAVSVALLAAAMLHPVIRWATGKGVPKGASVAVTVVFALCAVVGFIVLVGNSIVAGVPQLASATTRSLDAAQRWLVDGPLHLDDRQLGNLGNDLAALVRDNESTITRGALLTVASLGELVTVGLLAVFTLIFILYDGSGIWRFLTSGIRGPARDKIRAAGSAGFSTLTSYVHATTIVAIIDAVGIGVGLLILGVPLAFPLAGLVFVGAFIPIVGALLAGSLAVGVTLVTQGWTSALIALAIVIVVMQFESHVLQPFLLGRSVRLHPLAVVLGIAAGTVTAGIIGGILAVPLIAFCNTAIRSLRAGGDEKNHATTESDTDHTDTWDTGAGTGDITPEDGEN